MSILSNYHWTGKLTPYAHQKVTADFLVNNPKAFCFNEQGTGKTASVIWAADYLMKQGLVKRVLVLCPLSIMKAAWQQDLFKFAMHRSCSVAYSSTAEGRKKIVQSGAEFVIANYDGANILKQELINGGFDLIVVDEANAYKNPATKRWRTFKDISANIPRIWMLTGTPAAQSPLDAYGLAKIINPANTPKYYGLYRDMVMYKASQFRWMPKPAAKTVVHSVLQPAIRFEKKDCIDLPPVTYVERDAPMTPMQKAYYKLLRSQMLFSAGDELVTSVNAAVKMSKLLQIASGAVYTDTGEVLEFDVSNRLNVVLEVVEESSHKVLIFVPFTHTIELLQNLLEKHNISCSVINGAVSMNKRSQIVHDFQTKPDPHVLIIQPQAASHGLTLTAANTVIWYAPISSVETYLQANARIDRPGQQNNMTIYNITGSDVETRLYKMLQTNVMNHQQIIDLYKQVLANSP